jgi:hypothetical protein
MTIWNDTHTFEKPVVFAAEVTFSETPAEISLDNLTSLTGTGTATFADLAATDDLTVGDRASITGDLAVGGAATVTGNLTGSATVQGADLIATDDLTVGDDATVGGDLAVDGTVSASGLDLSFAALADIDLPGGLFLVKSWSATVDTSAFTTGATATINLATPPTAITPIGVLVTTASGDTVASSNGSTTGLAVEIGIASDPDLYMTSISVFGAAGAKQGAPGVGLGGYRAADTIQAKFTATGGAPDVGHITGMELTATVYYLGGS